MIIEILTNILPEVNFKCIKDAKNTDTEGKYSYVVALLTGGVMEMVNWECTDYQIIHADTLEEAQKKYNTLNKCSYYYGHTICRILDGTEVQHAQNNNCKT